MFFVAALVICLVINKRLFLFEVNINLINIGEMISYTKL